MNVRMEVTHCYKNRNGMWSSKYWRVRAYNKWQNSTIEFLSLHPVERGMFLTVQIDELLNSREYINER